MDIKFAPGQKVIVKVRNGEEGKGDMIPSEWWGVEAEILWENLVVNADSEKCETITLFTLIGEINGEEVEYEFTEDEFTPIPN